ncbi:MAG: replicative DNA helicase [Paludibacteraceae bacterium]|nr:replicative DNA helicase [Candidatus Physcocola equi]MCQ2234292.1 replicative DNA helicase [Paludibacteraceae bacterium]
MPVSNNTTKRPRKSAPEELKPDEYGKMPPNDIKLEETVLGALLIDSAAYGLVTDILKPETFYQTKNRYVYESIRNLASKQEPIDMLTVCEQLRCDGHLEDVGGEYYVTSLTSRVNSSANVLYHAELLAKKYLSRELIRFSTEIERKAYNPEYDVDLIMQEAEGKLFEISQRNTKRDFSQIDPLVSTALDLVQEAKSREGMSGVPSGFTLLDKMTSGWQKSDLIIIAARPAMGKTAFVLSMARNMADLGHGVALFSLEMSNIQLVNRLLVNVSELSAEKIKTGRMEKYEWQQLQTRARDLYDKPIFLDDTPSLSVFEFNTKARRLVKEHGVKIIIIDYLQLMNASGMNFGSREQEVSIISRSLKQMAKELNVPIIALSQLNRGVEGRTGADKRPQLADLRESGAIEQDADMVLFIHRPEYYKILEDEHGNSMVGVAQIIIAKHRNGAVGDVNLRFKAELAKFMNMNDQKSNEIQSTINSSDGPQASPADAPAPFNDNDPLGGDIADTPY